MDLQGERAASQERRDTGVGSGGGFVKKDGAVVTQGRVS